MSTRKGVVRATVIDWRAHSSREGASITQQLVKLRLVGNSPTIDRKIRRSALAFEIEKRRYTKPQILEMGLNSVLFGDTARRTKSGRTGLIAQADEGPRFAPSRDAGSLIRVRRSTVRCSTGRRPRTGSATFCRRCCGTAITSGAAANAFAEDISPPSHMFMPINRIVAADFVRYVTDQLVNRYGSDLAYGGGPYVVTTLNLVACRTWRRTR